MFRIILLIITCHNVVTSDGPDLIIPDLFKFLFDEQTTVKNDESWLKPQPILFKLYIYNVTNADSFLDNGTKPEVEELGPYVYDETWERKDVVSRDNGRVSFNQKKIYKFNSEQSNGTEDDVVIVPNIPMLSTTSVSKHATRHLRQTLAQIFDILKIKPFVEVSVGQLLWGYQDPFLKLAKQASLPGRALPFDEFGLLYDKNGTSQDRITLSLNRTIEAINDQPYLTHDTSEKCKNLKAFDGRVSAPFFDKDEVLHIYSEHFCRVLPLAYEDTVTTSDNSTIYRLTPSNDNNSEASCFCPEGPPCAPSGFFNVSMCKYDSPILVSFPHFYLANDSYRTALEGISPPDPEKHKYYVDFDPAKGIVKRSKSRIQINLAVSHVDDIKQVANFPDNIFPIMWFEEGMDMQI